MSYSLKSCLKLDGENIFFNDIYFKYGFILIKNHQRIINVAVSHKIRIGENIISICFIAVISSLIKSKGSNKRKRGG